MDMGVLFLFEKKYVDKNYVYKYITNFKYNVSSSIINCLKGPCDRLRDTGTPSGRKRKILELSSYDT